jgi:hypothetical protein
VERRDRFTVLLPNAPSPIAQAAGIPNLVGRLGLVDSPDNPKPLRGGDAHEPVRAAARVRLI